MNENSEITRNSLLWREEEKKKNKIYQHFEKERAEKQWAVKKDKDYIESGAYEGQDSSVHYNKLANSQGAMQETERLIESLFPRPYFAHLKTEKVENMEATADHYFLSDCTELDAVMPVSKNEYLLPFKKDSNRPMFERIFHAYQVRNGEHFLDLEGNEMHTTLICDDEISNGDLIDVSLVYSENEEERSRIDSDAILERKLRENRGNPELKNIISTLQLKQFEIIQSDENSDFAVQGCAGSGKSQILLHRLFFFRDVLSDENWDKVLLITPTELFRNYSSNLIKRYGLSSIRNTSIAEFYKRLLEAFDSNFKNRQYKFEMTEEYLPDEFLSKVYSSANVQQIDTEIKNAIFKYVSTACDLLEIEIQTPINIQFIRGLIEGLSERIENIEKDEHNPPKMRN